MRTGARQVLAAVLLGAAGVMLHAGMACGQESEVLAVPVPAAPSAPLPPPVLGPRPNAPAPRPPPLQLPLDPGRDGWGPYDEPSLPPGWFINPEVALIHPVLRFRLTNDTPLSGTGDTLTVPGSRLNWTVAPWIDAGYLLPRSLGYFSVNYRFFNADGRQTAVLDNRAAEVRSRLDENLINIDYGSTPFAFEPRWDFEWRIGVQLADVYFDSAIANDRLSQQGTNSFRGAGPHARMDIDRHILAVPGLSLFGRLEGAGVLGRITQKFREGLPNPGTEPTGFWEQNGTQMVPVLWVQAGLSYVPPGNPNWKFTVGYTYEHWWYVGQLGEDSNGGAQSATRGEFETEGVFLRLLVNF
jgi:hypothetical protein